MSGQKVVPILLIDHKSYLDDECTYPSQTYVYFKVLLRNLDANWKILAWTKRSLAKRKTNAIKSAERNVNKEIAYSYLRDFIGAVYAATRPLVQSNTDLT